MRQSCSGIVYLLRLTWQSKLLQKGITIIAALSKQKLMLNAAADVMAQNACGGSSFILFNEWGFL